MKDSHCIPGHSSYSLFVLASLNKDTLTLVVLRQPLVISSLEWKFVTYWIAHILVKEQK